MKSINEANPRNIDVGSFVVYQSNTGGSYHIKPSCAVDSDISPALDAANDVLSRVSMSRVEEIKDNTSPEDFCSTCAEDLRRAMLL